MFSVPNTNIKMSYIKFEISVNEMEWLTEEHVKKIISNYGIGTENCVITNFVVHKASEKMLGFLADYWKLKVHLLSNGNKNTLSFFIKSISQNNSKADMVREMKLFEKETNFYNIIKSSIELEDLRPWSAKLVLAHNEAIVFEDLNALGYKLRNKFETFDRDHTEQALCMLARFHACSIIYERRKTELLQRPYKINEEFGANLDKGGYYDTNIWFLQCMKGALAAIKSYSKYRENDIIINNIETHWKKIWSSGIDLSNVFPEECNVICHRDLWNNNILFRYKKVRDELVPNDCVMVDFQAVRCQPPAGDVMLLLYCNLEPRFREENMESFLRFYHQNLGLILDDYGINISDVLPLQSFLQSAERQRLWALVVAACLVPQMWLDDELTTNIFCDTEQFNDILSNDKASFIRKMIETNDQYRNKVMQIFEEIVDRYCLVQNNISL